MRTITVKKGDTGGLFTEGWNSVEITKAEYGDWQGSKFLDVWFKDYPESLNMRIYAKEGKDGEEFAIGQVFRFANAGIQEALEGADGTTSVTIDDDPKHLVGKNVNVMLYKQGKYFRVLPKVAPVEFTGKLDTMTLEDITFWKGKADKYFQDFVAPKLQKEVKEEVVDSIDDVF